VGGLCVISYQKVSYWVVRSSRRRILPTLLLGSSSRNSMYRGRL